jgi:WD40 repeat protein
MKLINIQQLPVTLAGALAVLTVPSLCGQSSPDVVWRTNAHDYEVMSLAFSPDGSMLASGGADGVAKLWRVSDGALLRIFSMGQSTVAAVAISPDGQYLAAGTDDDEARRTLYLWRIEDGVLLWRGGGIPVYAVAFSPDGIWLACAQGDWMFGRVSLVRVDWTSGKVLYDHSDIVLAVDFSPDGSLLASGSFDRTAKVWSVPDGVLVRDLIEHPDVVQSVKFHPLLSSDVLATGSSETRLWRVRDGAVLRILESRKTSTVAFSADGRLVATVEGPIKFFSLTGGPIRFWRTSDGRLLVTHPDADARALALSPDGKWFAYGRADRTVVLARMPLWISEVTCTGNEVTLQWQGGTGRYQLQGRTNLMAGQWQDIGDPTTNRIATHRCLNQMFYRVQSLPNP